MRSPISKNYVYLMAMVALGQFSAACGNETTGTGTPDDTSVGGSPTNVGGTANTIGGAFNSSGGSKSSGTTDGSGGSTSTGGSNVGTGGTNTGGANVGGTNATGGISTSTGGKAARGGSAGTGGKATGGASTGTGGQSTGGTTTSTGGANNTGGSTSTAAKFSFFVISYKAIQAKSGSAQGFGGDLRYGTGDGLAGADKICTEVAEGSMPGNGKTWRAYLSTSTVNAIDRIGNGPWYDRLGRLVTASKAGLLSTRPSGADSAIVNDLPNEDGVPNHAPDGKQVDNHDTLTGTNHNGTLYGATAHCSNWTSSAKSTSQKPRVGHTWPRGSAGSGNNPGMAHWASSLDESGCGPGVNLIETGGPGNDGTVGSGGGYGGWYCFALTP